MSEKYLVTERLLLRPWETVDAERLFSLASDEELAFDAGWRVHTSVEYSRKIIEDILSTPGEFAIVPRSLRKIAGAVGIKQNPDANFKLDDGDAEIGYWIGKDYRGNGYIPEAVDALLRYGFEELELNNIWCLCKDSNRASMRVQEKCGFRYVRNGIINDSVYGELEMRFTCITKKEWCERRDVNQNF